MLNPKPHDKTGEILVNSMQMGGKAPLSVNGGGSRPVAVAFYGGGLSPAMMMIAINIYCFITTAEFILRKINFRIYLQITAVFPVGLSFTEES